MARRRRTRIHFDLFARIRDHHDCDQYEDCLDHAAIRNAPRVCIEECELYRAPHCKEPFIIAEILDHLHEELDRVGGSDLASGVAVSMMKVSSHHLGK